MDKSFEGFNVNSIKLGKDGKRVIVTGSTGNPDQPGDQTNFKELTKNAIPHPDFTKAMDKFKSMLLRACGYGSKECKSLVTDMTMIGVSISGEEENKAAILSAKLGVKGGTIALNTPRIVFAQSNIGIEASVEEFVEDLKVEAHSYLFEDKRSDPEMFESEEETNLSVSHKTAKAA